MLGRYRNYLLTVIMSRKRIVKAELLCYIVSYEFIKTTRSYFNINLGRACSSSCSVQVAWTYVSKRVSFQWCTRGDVSETLFFERFLRETIPNSSPIGTEYGFLMDFIHKEARNAYVIRRFEVQRALFPLNPWKAYLARLPSGNVLNTESDIRAQVQSIYWCQSC